MNYDQSILDTFTVHLVQIGDIAKISDNEHEANNSEIVTSEIIEKLDMIDFRMDKKDIVVFPELIVPNTAITKIEEYAKNTRSFIIAGMNIDDHHQNRCSIIDPQGNIYIQYKLNPTNEEGPLVKKAHEELDKILNIFVNTPIGDFAVLICYDFLDPNLLIRLRGKIDSLFVVSMNKSPEKFKDIANDFAYSAFYHIFICNIAEHGHSAIYGPFFPRTFIKELPAKNWGILEQEIKIKEYRDAISDNISYRTKQEKSYSGIPAKFCRDFDWWKEQPEIILERTFLDWEKNRNNILSSCRLVLEKFNDNRNDINLCITAAKNHISNRGSLQEIFQLVYLLEDLKKQSNDLKGLNDLIKSGEHFRTGGSFTGLDRMKFEFKTFNEFTNMFHIFSESNFSESDLEKNLGDVATYCRMSCESYPEITKRCNYASMVVPNSNIILITSRNKDKSQIKAEEIVLVSEKASATKKIGQKKFEYYFANIKDDPNILPSKETYLSYEVHRSVSRAKALLHFHHEDILELAWKIPIIYGTFDIDDNLKIDKKPTPSLNGRNISIIDFTNEFIEKLQNNRVSCGIGVRHGCWAIGNDLKICLDESNRANRAAKINRNEGRRRILRYIEKEFEDINKDWR